MRIFQEREFIERDDCRLHGLFDGRIGLLPIKRINASKVLF